MKKHIVLLSVVCLITLSFGQDSLNVRYVGTCNIQSPRSVYVRGPRAYVSTINSLRIIDVSDPADPQELGAVDIPKSHNYTGVQVVDSFAYIASKWLFIVDISVDSQPCLIGNYGHDTVTEFRDVFVARSHAFAGNFHWQGGYKIASIDVSNPYNPQYVGHASIGGSFNSIHGTDDWVYVGRNNAFVVVSISNPGSPLWVGQCWQEGRVWGVHVSECNPSHVYALGWRLKIVDISNPPFPHVVDSIITGWSYGLDVSGQYIYVVNGEELKIFYQDEQAPWQLIGYYDTPNIPRDIYVEGNLIFIVDTLGSLQIYEHMLSCVEEKNTVAKTHYLTTTIFSGFLDIPEGKSYKVFDITGRIVTPNKIKPGIYFIEVDGEITHKIIKVK